MLSISDTCLQHFYSANHSTCIGKVYKTDNYLANGDVTNANYENILLSPLDQHEMNTKRMNEILINFDNTTMSSLDISDALSIANQCPLEGGKAVYTARAFYNSIQVTNLIYFDNCDLYTRNAGSLISTEDENFNLFVYPNPATNKTTLTFNSIDANDSYFSVSSIDGKILLKQLLQLGTTIHELDCSSIANGIYLVNLYVSGTLRANEKLIINK